jgi:hypothetical protein
VEEEHGPATRNDRENRVLTGTDPVGLCRAQHPWFADKLVIDAVLPDLRIATAPEGAAPPVIQIIPQLVGVAGQSVRPFR